MTLKRWAIKYPRESIPVLNLLRFMYWPHTKRKTRFYESIVAPNHILNELILKGTNQTYDTVKTRLKKSDYSFTFFEATFFDKTHTRMTEEDYRSFALTDAEG